jgi:peroxiredoxin
MPTLRPGDRFPNVTLATVGGPVELEERWRDGPLIVAFMRHFGCPFCREQLIQMTRAWDDIRSAGAGAVAIFQYRAESTRNFCHHRKIPFDCLGDPAKQAYDAVGLGRGRGKRREYLGPKAVKGWFRVARSGAVIGIPHGDIACGPPPSWSGRAARSCSPITTRTTDNPKVEWLLEAVGAAAEPGGALSR